MRSGWGPSSPLPPPGHASSARWDGDDLAKESTPKDPPSASISQAARHLPAEPRYAAPRLVVDSGIENINAAVDDELQTSAIQRVIAQVDITFSNSMIEAFWRSLKHNWLFLNELDSIASLRRLVAFYVEQHNSVMPPSTFLRCPARRGRTPDEIFSDTARDIHEQLHLRAAEARRTRIVENKSLSCSRCHNSS